MENLGSGGSRLMVGKRKMTGMKREGKEMNEIGKIGYE